MSRKIFIAATGQHCGKTTVSVSLMHLARKRYERVGFMKPIGPKCVSFNGITMDKDAVLMAKICGLEEDASLMSPVTLGKGSTKRFLDGEIDPGELAEKIAEACRRLEAKNDFIVVEGSGHGGVGSVVGLSNAAVAKLTGAPVVMVAEGGIGKVIDSVRLNLALYEKEGVEVKMVLVNKLLPEKREESLSYLRKAFRGSGIVIASAFDYSPILANPTLRNLSRLLEHPLKGDASCSDRIVHNVQLCAASSQKSIDLLRPSTLLISTSSRDELIVTVSSLYHIPAYRELIAGMVIPGHAPVSPVTQQILDGSGIPYIRIQRSTAEVFTLLSDHVSKITAEDREKLDLLTSTAETALDFPALDRLCSC
jgi:BioD-like phosphotransacetylase family protein